MRPDILNPLFAEVEVLKGIGPALAKPLHRLKLDRVVDILFHLPVSWIDRKRVEALDEADVGQVIIVTLTARDYRQGGRGPFRIFAEDNRGNYVTLTYFNNPGWGKKQLPLGEARIVSGRLDRYGQELQMVHPDYVLLSAEAATIPAREPVYPLSEGLTNNRLGDLAAQALARRPDLAEWIEPSLKARMGWPDWAGALETAHRDPAAAPARARLAYDEVFANQLAEMLVRASWRRRKGEPLKGDGQLRDKLKLPHELTGAQQRSVSEIEGDLQQSVPMLRLLQGDVGSGKTAVAAWALAAAAQSGRQGALLAPTDLLARQHLGTVAGLLDGVGVPVTLLTGSLSAEGRRNALEQIRSGQAGVVVGTHALIQEAVEFADLGLVVIDEQHRFGVEQRHQLEAKAGGQAPHVLLMTATPIPRTLGQLLYADLDVSDLRTPPEGRVPIRTGIRASGDLDGTWQRVRDEAAAGHRIFVVVPLIEEGSEDSVGDEASSAVAAESEAIRLNELLAPLRVGLVHGRMKPVERDAEMTKFRDGALDVLVGTTVVEVGVDVPEATMMIVEGADRFGLAQLHQLRGRVGRGTAESFCVLVSDSTDEVAQARLKAVAELRDGFALAEKDFELRREGDVLGLAQSGLPRLRVASIQERDHQELAALARGHAESLLDERGRLTRGHEALAAELAGGWLRQVAEADPKSAA